MESIFKNEYLNLDFDKDHKILHSYWEDKSQELDGKQEKIKEIISQAATLIQEYKPLYYIADDIKRDFVYEVSLQNWVAECLGSALAISDVKKMAIILPKGMVEALSTEQTREEAGNLPFEIGYFENAEEAMKWFDNRF